LFAAAVAGRSMADVARWVGQPRDRAVLDILERHPTTPPGWAADVRQLLDEAPERTRESVFLSLALNLQFLSHPQLAATVSPRPGEPTFDVGRFIAEGGTLYLLGSERPHDSVAPLYTALTGHIFETAKRLAADRPHGRLDPPLLLALDEAALICPVPLDRWTADAGGRGIPLLLAVQTQSQLYERWGRLGGQTIWSNAAVKLIFGGLTVREHLDDLLALCGDRYALVRGLSKAASLSNAGDPPNRSKQLQRVPVFTADRLRTLKTGQVVILHRGTRPVLARIEPVWARPDVRRVRRPGDV
jgi:type IV secretory pathway TraG/TraD family ATPase VirD4